MADHVVRILHHIADLAAALGNAVIAGIPAVNKDLAGIRPVYSGQKAGQRALSGPVLSKNGHHLSPVDIKGDIVQRIALSVIAESDVPERKGNGLCAFLQLSVPASEPVHEPVFVRRDVHCIEIVDVLIAGYVASGSLEGRYIKRLTGTCADKDSALKNMRRTVIHDNPALIHKHDPVHMPMQDILDSVLNYDDCLSSLAVKLVNKLDGPLACRRIKGCKRLVKQQDRDIVNKHAGQSDALLLPA